MELRDTDSYGEWLIRRLQLEAGGTRAPCLAAPRHPRNRMDSISAVTNGYLFNPLMRCSA
jgi:hypothetical protein